jgi:hypothetical protein
MRKCPYCSKEIQNDVTVCTFCGHNINDLARPVHWFWYLVIGFAGLFGLSIAPILLLLPGALAGTQPSSAAIIFGLLISLGVYPAFWWIAAKGRYSKVNFWGFGNTTMMSLVPFVGGWWCIYYFGKGVYMLFTKQKLLISNNPIKAGGILLICSIVIGLLIWGVTSGQPAAKQVPNLAQLPTAAPYIYSTQDASLFLGSTPTIAPSCFQWNQITMAMEGRTVCVTGTAAQVYTVYGNAQTRVNFTTAPNTFFLISTNLEFYYFQPDGTRRNLAAGDCVQATDVVKVFDDGRHRIPYMQITDLYRCGP